MLRIRGSDFSERSVNSSRKSCMPPILRKGRMTMAKPMMPMPPIHWVVERHSSTERATPSRPTITVAPVVVMPDTISK